jgi:flagellar assembly protein FliH
MQVKSQLEAAVKTPSSSRIVFAEDLAKAAPWKPGPLGGQHPDRKGQAPSPQAAPAGTPIEPGFEDGLREGFEKGLHHAQQMTAEAVRAQHLEFAQRADALIAALTDQLATLQQSVAESVIELAVEIARSATGAAIRIDADLVSPAVQEALAAIVDEHARPTVRVNPYDASLMSEHLAPMLASRGAHLVPDPTISRGGCRVDTTRASVDASVQTRWQYALAALGRNDSWVDT